MLSAQRAEALMNANAAALDLRIAAEHKPGVVQYLVLASGMADLVLGQALGIEDESGAVFEPATPRGPAA